MKRELIQKIKKLLLSLTKNILDQMKLINCKVTLEKAKKEFKLETKNFF